MRDVVYTVKGFASTRKYDVMKKWKEEGRNVETLLIDSPEKNARKLREEFFAKAKKMRERGKL